MIARIVFICFLWLAPGLAHGADQAMVEAARREGALAIADSAPGENFQKFLAAFKAKYQKRFVVFVKMKSICSPFMPSHR